MIAVLGIFIAAQLILNIPFKVWGNQRVNYVFASLAPLGFAALMLVYSFFSSSIYFWLYPPYFAPGEVHCGNAMIGPIFLLLFIQWIVGTPFVFYLQVLLNKYFLKIRFEGKAK